MTTVPEKRLNKHGVLVTKHVLAAPRAKTAAHLPAPSADINGTGVAGPKLRPSQRKQQSYSIPVEADVDELLIDDDVLEEMMSGGSYFVYSASEEESYAVLSATKNIGDALHMLSLGIRTMDEAYGFLEEHQAEHLKADHSELTNELLSRNVDSSHLVENRERLTTNYPDTSNIADLIELNSIRGFKSQCYTVEPFIAEDEVSLSDIKAVGVADLKIYDRLIDSLPALADIKNNPATKTSVEDISWVIDRLAKEVPGNNQSEYGAAIEALVSVGREGLAPVRDLTMLSNLSRNYRRRYADPERKTVYAAIVLQTTPKVPSEELEKLFDSGIEAHHAGDMLLKGMSVDQILDARDNGIAISVSEGWL